VPPRVAVFAPHPLLSITIERRGDDDDVHVHAAGQGVWVARMAAELGAEPVLCGFAGGEPAVALVALLDRLPGEWRLTRTAAPTGCYVTDRRDGERRVVARAWATPPSRHELDDLVSATCAAALTSELLVVCNPFPGDSLPIDVYGRLVADVRQNGTPVLVDLSSPRLERALEGRPELVKLNDWELAEAVRGPVGTPAAMDAAVAYLRDLGARTVVVTRGADPCVVYREDEVWRLVPPRFERGAREGCGDAMMGALAACRARGLDWRSALATGAAAGAANFLRHGLGTGRRDVVEELARSVRLEPRDQPAGYGTTGSSPASSAAGAV
jgi:1-phosphofructokinase